MYDLMPCRNSKPFYIFMSFSIMILLPGCNNVLDISTLELGSNAQQYDLENNKNLEKNILKGHYEWKNVGEKKTLTTVDNGEKIINYYEINKFKNQFNYSGVPTDSTWDVKIVVYNDEIAEINVTFSKENSFQFIETILKKLGNPSEISCDITHLNKNIDKKIYYNFKKYFPKDTELKKDSSYVDKKLTYPRSVLWDKEKSIIILSIFLENDGELRLVYSALSKKPFFERVLYPAPQKEAPFYEYLK
jgi:hypothetical protein